MRRRRSIEVKNKCSHTQGCVLCTSLTISFHLLILLLEQTVSSFSSLFIHDMDKQLVVLQGHITENGAEKGKIRVYVRLWIVSTTMTG